MGIDLTWTDDNGVVLDSVSDTDDHFAAIVERVRAERAGAYPMIRTIDPYGTTRFAAPQTATLLRELEALRAQAAPAVSITVGHFMSILRAADAMPGTWLRFDGD